MPVVSKGIINCDESEKNDSLVQLHRHQTFTGAVNPGDNCYSVGNIDGYKFVAYGSGTDLVILTSSLECIQIIPGTNYDNIQVGCIECSSNGGKIAASYAHQIYLFEPICNDSRDIKYNWHQIGFFQIGSFVSNLSWNPDGTQILTTGDNIQLWSQADSSNMTSIVDWYCSWQTRTSTDVHHISFSPDGKFFATAGSNDCLIKVWCKNTYPDILKSKPSFYYLYLAHPKKVLGVFWRKMSKFTPDNSLANFLLTASDDGICRIWAETRTHSDGLTSTIPSNNRSVHFHIVSSINPAMDIPLVDHYSRFSKTSSQQFIVHWLNNKELYLTFQIELRVHHLRKTNSALSLSNCSAASLSTHSGSIGPSDNYDNFLDQALDSNLSRWISDWRESRDMLFCIHPVDGSLLIWSVEHLDWASPYARHPVITFSARIPSAFPSSDANSCSAHLIVYTNSLSSDIERLLAITRTKQSFLFDVNSVGDSVAGLFAPNVLVLSKHKDGSLNEWEMAFDPNSRYSQVQSVSHLSRRSGHRFDMAGVACHPTLPLLLTTSHHNIPAMTVSQRDDFISTSEPSIKRKITAQMSLYESALPNGLESRDIITTDPNLPHGLCSELILWRAESVGALGKSGGLTELARVHSPLLSAFAQVAWLPGLFPTNWLQDPRSGSPAACFVAFDNGSLCVFAAIIDAVSLLSKSTDSAMSLKIVSHQSTSHPGCILYLDAIDSIDPNNVILLHVFDSASIEDEVWAEDSTQENFTNDRYYVVAVYNDSIDGATKTIIKMWQLTISIAKRATETNPISISSKLVSNQPLYPNEGMLATHGCVSTSHPGLLHVLHLKPPYLLAVASEHYLEFFKCTHVKGRDQYNWDTYDVIPMPWVIDSVSCYHPWRVAVAFQVPGSDNEFSLVVKVFESESSGGEQWRIEDTLNVDHLKSPRRFICSKQLRDEHRARSRRTNSSAMSVELNRNASFYKRTNVSHTEDCISVIQKVYLDATKDSQSNPQRFIHVAWIPRHDGTSLLSICSHKRVVTYAQNSSFFNTPSESTLKNNSIMGKKLLQQRSTVAQVLSEMSFNAKWQPLSEVMISTADGLDPFPVVFSWLANGLLILGLSNEMQIYSQWQTKHHVSNQMDHNKDGLKHILNNLPSNNLENVKKGPTSLLNGSVTSLETRSSVYKNEDIATSIPSSIRDVMDMGLLEESRKVAPVLPQYHPQHLLALLNFGKLACAKAILAHLLRSMVGEGTVAIAVNEGSVDSVAAMRRRVYSTISVVPVPERKLIENVPPLQLHHFLEVEANYESIDPIEDNVFNKSPQSELFNDSHTFSFGREGSFNEELFGVSPSDDVAPTPQLDGNYFGPAQSSLLSDCLMKTQIPDLSSLDQMHLVALAEVVAHLHTGWTDALSARGKDSEFSKGAADQTIDECGMRFVTAMKLHFTLLRSLPLNQRNALKAKGMHPSHFVWAHFSESEEEMLNSIPAFQRNNPTWMDLKSVGAAWWLNSITNLRSAIEKVARSQFQAKKDPMDSALFYIAMKRKTVLWGLFRSTGNQKMTDFFRNDFSTEHWQRIAMKNAFALNSKQRYEHAAAFFLLAGQLKDAIRICIGRLNDIQLAIVISRLYDEDLSLPDSTKGILNEHILSQPDVSPLLKSISRWWVKEYEQALNEIIDISSKSPTEYSYASASIFNFYHFLRTHPLCRRRQFARQHESSNKNPTSLIYSNNLDSITLAERRLFFYTAQMHFDAGCPILALEVLKLLPPGIIEDTNFDNAQDVNDNLISKAKENEEAVDWGAPTKVDFDIGFDLDNSLDDIINGFDIDDGTEDLMKDHSNDESDHKAIVLPPDHLETTSRYLKHRCCIKILVEELRSLASSSDFSDSQFRNALSVWLEKSVRIVSDICELNLKQEHRRLIAILLHYADVYGGSGGGLASVYLELGLIAARLEIGLVRLPKVGLSATLPLFAASCSGHRVGANVIHSLQRFVKDVARTIAAHPVPPTYSDIKLALTLRNLAAALASCLYQSLQQSACDENSNEIVVGDIISLPSKWPGVQSLLSSLNPQNSSIDAFHLRVLLAEVIVTVYLSLLFHAIAVNDACVMTRLVAQPFDENMLAEIAGGRVNIYLTPPSSQPARFTEQRDQKRRDYNLKNSGVLNMNSQTNEEKVIYTERFKSPRLTLIEYFLQKPKLSSSANYNAYDSDNEVDHDDFSDVDSIPPDDTEHSDFQSYSWCLMRLALVSQALNNVFLLIPLLGIERSELPLASPLIQSCLKLLEQWRHFMTTRLDLFSGPPEDYMPTPVTAQTTGSRPALLRYKDVLEPDITPFRSEHPSALPVKRLWHFLARKNGNQNIFINYCFSRNPQDENLSPDVTSKTNSYAIFKDSDSVTNFCFNHVPISVHSVLNCLVVATPKEVHEIDISSVLSAKSMNFSLENDLEKDSMTPSLSSVQNLSAGSIAGLINFISPRSAKILMTRTLPHVRKMDAHPSLPFYVTGCTLGNISLCEWGHQPIIRKYKSAGCKITGIHFNTFGNKFGVSDESGNLSLFHSSGALLPTINKPFMALELHVRQCSEFAFVGSSSLIATCHQTSSGKNLCLWDTLLPSKNQRNLINYANLDGLCSLIHSPEQQALIAGGVRGEVYIYDLRQRRVRSSFNAHESGTRSLAVNDQGIVLATGSRDGELKLFDLNSDQMLYKFPNEHRRESLFRTGPQGVLQLRFLTTARLLSCGSDGSVKIRDLSNVHIP